MNEQLKTLYQTVILKHNQQPFHFEKKEKATHQVDAYNPLCGDRFTLYFEIENEQIETMSFYGYGCAISKASTSILVKNMEGKSIKEGLSLCQNFQQMLEPNAENKNIDREEFEAFIAARDFPARLQCAILSWKAMQDFLNQSVLCQ